MSRRNIIDWFINKWRSRAAEAGHYTTALQMRKQGIPFEVAHAILIGGVAA